MRASHRRCLTELIDRDWRQACRSRRRHCRRSGAGVTLEFTYVSMAGGAFLEWLEGRTLPGIAALARPPS